MLGNFTCFTPASSSNQRKRFRWNDLEGISSNELLNPRNIDGKSRELSWKGFDEADRRV